MAKKLVRKLKSCRNIRNIYENIWPTKKCSIKQQDKFKMASKPILIQIQFHAVCLNYNFKNGSLVPKRVNTRTRSNITSRNLAISVLPYTGSTKSSFLCKACSASHGFYDFYDKTFCATRSNSMIPHRFYNSTPTTLSSRYARLPAPIRVTTPIWRRAHSWKPPALRAAMSFEFFWNILLHIGFVDPTIVSKNGASGWALMFAEGQSSKLLGSTFCSISLKSSRERPPKGVRSEDRGPTPFYIEACHNLQERCAHPVSSPRGHTRALPLNKSAQLYLSSPQYSTDPVENLLYPWCSKDLLTFFCLRALDFVEPTRWFSKKICDPVCSTAPRRNGIGGPLCCSEASDHSDFQTTTIESAPPKIGSFNPPYGFACQASEKRCLPAMPGFASGVRACAQRKRPRPFDQCTSMAKPWRTIVLFGTARRATPFGGPSPGGPMTHLCDGIGSLCGYFVNNMTQQFCMTMFILRQGNDIIRVPFRGLSVNALVVCFLLFISVFFIVCLRQNEQTNEQNEPIKKKKNCCLFVLGVAARSADNQPINNKKNLITVGCCLLFVWPKAKYKKKKWGYLRYAQQHRLLFCAYLSWPKANQLCCSTKSRRGWFKALEPFAQINNFGLASGQISDPGCPPEGGALLGRLDRYRCKSHFVTPTGEPLRYRGCEAFGRATFARDPYSGYLTHAFEGIVNFGLVFGLRPKQCCSAGSQRSFGTPEGGRQNHWLAFGQQSKTRLFQSAAPSDPVPTEPLAEGQTNLLPLYVLRRALYQTRNPKSATQLKSLFRFQLQETKKLSLLYGNLSRKQIQKICNQAFTHPLSPDALTESVFVLLERRLDVVLFRAGFCKSIFQARQWIHHNKMNVNGRAQSAPGYLCSPGDIISYNSFHNVCKHLENFYITRRSRHAGGRRRSLGDTEPHTFLISTIGLRPTVAIPPLNLEVNYRNLTAVYLYSPQRIILPTFVDIYLVIRGLYR